MTNRDALSANQNFFHQQSQDLLTFSDVQRFGAHAKVASKRGEGLCKLQVLGLVDRGHLQRL